MRDLVLAAAEKDGLLVVAGDGLDVEPGGGVAEAETLADDAFDVLELLEVLEPEVAVADDRVDLLAGGVDDGGVLEEVVDDAGDGAGGGAAPDGHGDDLVDDLGVGEGLARLGVLVAHHGGQEVLAVGGVLLPLLHHVGGELAHGGDGLLELASVEEPVHDSRPSGTLDGLGGRVLHGL